MNKNAIKRAIALCWIMLIVCFIIKLFGGNWFEIICNNEHFINICNYVDTHGILRYSIGLIIYVVCAYFVFVSCSMIIKPNFKQSLAILIFAVGVWATNFIAPLAKMIAEILMFVSLPFILKRIELEEKSWKYVLKKSWYLGIIACALELVFQIISLITKNIGVKVIDNSFLMSLLFSIDYYIMIALYYLYTKLTLKNKKE